LQLGKLYLAGCELAETGSHAGLVSDDVSVFGVGFRLAAVGVAGSVYGESGDVEDSLLSLPQQCQKQRRRSSRLIHGPDDVLRKGEDLFDEGHEFCLIVFDLAGEKLLSRSVQYVRPVELLTRIYASPSSVHDHLRLSVVNLPVEHPADGSLCSDSTPISMSGQGLLIGAEGRFQTSHRMAELRKPSSAPGASSRLRTRTTDRKIGSYEQTEHFVSDSIVLRQFCRLYLEPAPDDTTLRYAGPTR